MDATHASDGHTGSSRLACDRDTAGKVINCAGIATMVVCLALLALVAVNTWGQGWDGVEWARANMQWVELSTPEVRLEPAGKTLAIPHSYLVETTE